MRFLCLLLLLLPGRLLLGQSETDSLPAHSGAMVLDLTGLHVTQRSAKAQNNEIGVRAHDDGHMELLTFLFLTPDHRNQRAASCMEQDLKPVLKASPSPKQQRNPFGRDSDVQTSALLTYPDGRQTLYKYFGGQDQCLMVQAYADKGTTLDVTAASALLDRQQYQPDYSPTLDYATKYQAIRGQALRTAQAPPTEAPKMLVAWYGPGGVPLPADPAWKLELLTVYNNGGRPVAQFVNDTTHVIASFLISENLSGKPTSEGCRDDRVEDLRKSQGELLSKSSVGTLDDGHGGHFATATHLTRLAAGAANHDVFVFAGSKTTCAEMHVSTVAGMPDEEQRLKAALQLFHPQLDYQGSCADFVPEAKEFSRSSPMLGAPFFDACLHTIPSDSKDPEAITLRRLATDQVVIALGMAGKLRESRRYATRAIELDPDYPLNYYNLACADAEEGNAEQARTHLEQAFARKQNALPDRPLPDPGKDDSLLKLKKNQDFWAFVQTLH